MSIFGDLPAAGDTHGSTVLPALNDQIVAAPKRRKVPVEVDLAFTIDRTGSSAAFAQGITTAVPMIAAAIAERAAKVRCFLQSHGDLDYHEHPVMLVSEGTIEMVGEEVRRMQYGGGGDAAEHHLDGVKSLFETVPWRGQRLRSRSCLVLFSTADTKPLASGMSVEALGAMLREAGVLFYAVAEPSPGIEALVKAADGISFPISNDPSADEMRSIAARVAASISASLSQAA
jgi:hypothetical protein